MLLADGDNQGVATLEIEVCQSRQNVSASMRLCCEVEEAAEQRPGIAALWSDEVALEASLHGHDREAVVRRLQQQGCQVQSLVTHLRTSD